MRFLSTSLLTVLLLQAGAEAAEYEAPVLIVAPSEVIVQSHLTNNDIGAVYDSATVAAYASLAQSVFALGSHGFGSVGEMMGGWNYNLSGQVSNGWVGTGNNDGTIRLTNNGGIPDLSYTIWRDTSTAPSQDEMFLNLGVPISQLELNATSGYQPFTLADVQAAGWDATLYDAVIVRSDSALLQAGNYTGTAVPGEIPEAFVGYDGAAGFVASGLHYLLLSPGDFAEWTDFSSRHPSLAAGGDANGNGRSNFLDYASGQDPEAAGLLPVVALSGNTLTLRSRVDGIDAQATALYSDDLDRWDPLEEGVHHTVVSNTVSGSMRTLVLELLPGQPERRFFRQRFSP